MAKILSPNTQYTGISAGVTFVNGIGETANPLLIAWFKEKGYEVQEDKPVEEIKPVKESVKEEKTDKRRKTGKEKTDKRRKTGRRKPGEQTGKK